MATKETMTIHKVLAELKLPDERIVNVAVKEPNRYLLINRQING